MLRMIVEGIGFDHLRQTVVVLKDWDNRKILPVWIGGNEAKAIAWELEGVTPPRPGTHDLLLSCVRAARGHVTRVVINDLQDAVFYATIDIDTPNGLLHIDARPSDAIAIAVRAKCPVFVDGGALGALIDVDEAALLNADEADASSERLLEHESGEPPLPPEIEASPGNPPHPPTTPHGDEIERFRRLLDD